MRSRFDSQLALLNTELIQMGALCEEAISKAAKALENGDSTLAEQVKPLEGGIDQMERDIETLCLKLLLQQQPVARDLRQIILAMLAQGYVPEDVGHIREMAAEVIRMVTESVDSYVQKDTVRARLVIAHDDIVDQCFDRVKQVLIGNIAANPACGGHALDLLMIDKYLERIGDHAVNIAEWVIFAVTGEHKGETL